MKSLLARYAHLRPAVQAALGVYVVDHWEGFAAKRGGFPSDPPPAANVSPAPESTRAGVPRQDWFERFLDAVRGLLFL